MIKRLALSTLYLALVGFAVFSAVTLLANAVVINAKNSGVYDDVANTPQISVAVVLGTTKRSVGGGVNPFFAKRIEAAAELYKAGKVDHILVSGDNRHKSHNEPVDMLNSLTALGVPAEAITLDYAGFRTLDTVYRAKKVFELDKVLLVTQRYHAYRTLYLAEKAGLQAAAFAAGDPKESTLVAAEMREYAARVKAVIDVHILRKQPHFLGEPEPIKIIPRSAGAATELSAK